MITDTLANIATMLHSPSVVNNQQFAGISFDTQTLKPGNLFIALPGKNHDGHKFLAHAAEQGAVAAIISDTNYTNNFLPTILVSDTIRSLGVITQNWRQQFTIPIIGITGSNGKTTVKNMLATILREHCNNQDAVLATTGNFNNFLGVPHMLAQLNKQHRYAVIEMGMSNLGEIAYLSQLVKPNIAIINNAGPAHLDNLGNITQVAQAKGEIFCGLKNPGTAVLNADDQHYTYWKNLAKPAKIVSFGLNHHSDVTGVLQHNDEPYPQQFSVIAPQGKEEFSLPSIGKHNIINALSAITAAIELDINLETIKQGIKNISSVAGRLQLHKFNNKINIIDDSYNANPISVKAAINTLADFSGKKIMILGDMAINQSIAHQDIGLHLKHAGIHNVFTYGNLAKFTSLEFAQTSKHFTSQDDLITAVKEYLTPNTTILIKGSRSMNMENIVIALQKVLQK